MNKYLFCFYTVMMTPILSWAAADVQVESSIDPQLQWSRSLTPKIQLRDVRVERLALPESVKSVAPQPTLPSSSGEGVVQALPVSSWAILMSDKTLYRALRRWSQEADYQLMWQVDRDYPIEAGVAFKNTFRGSVEQVMAGVALTDYPLQAIFNPNARILRVVRHQDDGRR